MSKAEIYAGNCGFTTQVQACKNGSKVELSIASECKAIQKLADELREVEPFQEISFRRAMPMIHQMGIKHCTHAACPVPVGIIKAVEIEAGLALPEDATIKLSK